MFAAVKPRLNKCRGTDFFLTEKEEGAISTLVLRGSTDNLMDDIERAVDDGVNTFKVLVRVSQHNKTL